jgi:hypothetical protein
MGIMCCSTTTKRTTELKRAKGQPAHHTTKQSYGEGRGHYSIARPAISRIKPWASDGTVQSCFPKGQAAVMRLMNCLWHIETAGKILPCGRTVFETFCVLDGDSLEVIGKPEAWERGLGRMRLGWCGAFHMQVRRHHLSTSS